MPTVVWRLCSFPELSTAMLYDILWLRSEVFVAGQNIVYVDADYKDQKAYHLAGYVDDRIVAYCRIFKPGDYFDDCAIGRVAVPENFRGLGLGHALMNEALAAVGRLWGAVPVTISAQMYLEKFYVDHGFVTISEPYTEEDIVHVKMRRL